MMDYLDLVPGEGDPVQEGLAADVTGGAHAGQLVQGRLPGWADQQRFLLERGPGGDAGVGSVTHCNREMGHETPG